MLVLSRKRGEAIVVGDNIRISIVEVQGNRVRLGIEAPTSVRVRREELPPEEPEAAALPVGIPNSPTACYIRHTDAGCQLAVRRRPRFTTKPR
jgi:carbon storage regulator